MMKITKFKEELRQLNLDKLHEKLDGIRKELFGVRLNSATAHIKDYSQFKVLRKQIARILTTIRLKEEQES